MTTSWLFALTPQDNPRRLPQCQHVDISRPLKALDAAPLPSSSQRGLPPLHPAPRVPCVPARPLPANPALRQAQVRPQLLIWWRVIQIQTLLLATVWTWASCLSSQHLYKMEIIQLLRWINRIVQVKHLGQCLASSCGAIDFSYY